MKNLVDYDNMPESPERIDYDLTEAQIRRSLREFGLQVSDINKMMLDVMMLVTTSQFYEDYETRYDLPDYAFQPTNIIEAGGYRENTRESVRKDALKPLRDKGVLGYHEPVPNSPKTHYYLSQEFREYLDNADLERILSEPDPAEDNDRVVVLPYVDSELHRAAGEHAELIADGLRDLIPELATTPILVHEGMDKTERENISEKQLQIRFGEYEFLLSVYPDAIVFDSTDRILYLLEAVTNRGPFTERRIDTLLEDLNHSTCETDIKESKQYEENDFEIVFITMFPDVGRYRSHLMQLGGKSYVWLSNHSNQLRAIDIGKLNSSDIIGKELEYRH